MGSTTRGTPNVTAGAPAEGGDDGRSASPRLASAPETISTFLRIRATPSLEPTLWHGASRVVMPSGPDGAPEPHQRGRAEDLLDDDHGPAVVERRQGLAGERPPAEGPSEQPGPGPHAVEQQVQERAD